MSRHRAEWLQTERELKHAARVEYRRERGREKARRTRARNRRYCTCDYWEDVVTGEVEHAWHCTIPDLDAERLAGE